MKDVSSLKMQAGEILSGAAGFMTTTGAANAALGLQTRKMLKAARAESRSQARHVLAEAGKTMSATRSAVAGLKTETGRVMSEASAVMHKLASASRNRAGAWRGIVSSLRTCARPATVNCGSGTSQTTKARKSRSSRVVHHKGARKAA
jgi:hypothetical protein